ncbi:hypothetical protein [Pseudomonas aeruginosa]|uniref:hypothetical protein n=1 Tax=Pseudomonas aeruginosa TaxID=287 RepID=UPI001F45649B|nr:hypothetical protein [Pseudomonas aeruginosa]
MKRKFFVAVLLSASLNQVVEAEPFWWAASYFDPHLRSAQLACEYSASRNTSWADNYYAGTLLSVQVEEKYGTCRIKDAQVPGWPPTSSYSRVSIVRWGDGCPDNQEYDANTGACLSPNGPPNHREKGTREKGTDLFSIERLKPPAFSR